MAQGDQGSPRQGLPSKHMHVMSPHLFHSPSRTLHLGPAATWLPGAVLPWVTEDTGNTLCRERFPPRATSARPSPELSARNSKDTLHVTLSKPLEIPRASLWAQRPKGCLSVHHSLTSIHLSPLAVALLSLKMVIIITSSKPHCNNQIG